MSMFPAADLPRRRTLAALLGGAALLAACAIAPSTVAPAAARAALAPTGTLRVAVYPGSPTSLVEPAPPAAMRGVSVDLGRSLAARLGVPAQVVVYPRLAEALAAVQRGDADFTITNATEQRAKLVDFAPTLVDLELGVLVHSSSRVTAADKMDEPGVTIGVSQGSSSERVLGGRFRQAKLRSFPTLDAARAALRLGEIDGFATNKAILFEQAQRLPGSRVLDGRWGSEHLAPAVPKGRDAGMPFLRAFADDVRRNGELVRASERAGLRGTAAPAQ
ncbi:transporter substrate-binding domain-containing protein [Caenimonas terrae]|uniref:Transporter substrate-binding domain-containing protein n=1 Tax=Caenimonas terrae TaxID=696074 RepID=A0ABW0NBF8_9BURK